MDDLFRKQRKAIENSRENYNRRYNQSSKERLYKIIATKMRTTFIGSLAKMEEEFGHLWGHGLKESELNENQKKWRSVYNSLRTRILNLGNDQLRAIENEFKQYNIVWERYQY